jgi:hypothetical protein
VNADKVIRQKARTAVMLARRVAHVWREEGTVPAAGALSTALQGFLPWKRRSDTVTSEFDQTNGVDTSGVVRIASMEISSPNYLYARYYKASNQQHFQSAMAGLDIDHTKYTFIDYGSGKGLTLLLASHYPFRRIVGVEFGADLHRIAQRNIQNYKSPDRRCLAVESVCGDAAEFDPPAGPLVCYFYDPFEPVVLQRVIETLRKSHQQAPRPIMVVYYGPPKTSTLHAEAGPREEILLGSGILRKVRTEDTLDVFETPEVCQERARHARG